MAELEFMQNQDIGRQYSFLTLGQGANMEALLDYQSHRMLSIILALLVLPSVLIFSLPDDKNFQELSITLTPEEQQWLEEHKSIRIAGPRRFPPFYFYDDEKQARGIASDYIQLLFYNLGLEAEIAADIPWPEVLEGVQSGNIDVITCSAKSRDREEYLLFTQPHLSFPLVIFTLKDAPFVSGVEDLEGKRIAVVEGVTTREWLEEDGISFEAVVVDNLASALEAVSMGKADAHIQNLASGSYLIGELGLTNLKVAAPTKYGQYDLFIAVRKDWPELVSILNKGLAAISLEQRAQMQNRWISIRYEYGLKRADLIKNILVVAGIALAIILLILLWNHRLSREIDNRKKVEKELRKAIDNIKTLQGLLPICSRCKSIRDDKGYWNQIEEYLKSHSDLSFSHGLCPSCAKELYGKEEWFLEVNDHNHPGD